MAKMKGCCYGGADNDKPSMKGSKEGLSSKGMMKGGKGGLSDKPMKGKGRTAHELHHHNRPHGHRGPKSPEGY